MYAIHPKSAAKARELLGLPEDAPLMVADLYRAADIEAAQSSGSAPTEEPCGSCFMVPAANGACGCEEA